MINKKLNVLVTGCGGDIGQSVGKILQEFSFIEHLYGCDISDKNAGKFIYSNFFVGLECNDPKYLVNLQQFVEDKEIDLIIPISEPELRFFSREKIKKIGNADLVMCSSYAHEIGFDKLKTADFLKSVNLPYPITHPIEDVPEVQKFPVILKSRTGSGSSNVYIVKDTATFHLHKNNQPGFIVQEYLDGNEGEFTCGVFRSKEHVIRTIIIKRELMGGFTGYGEVIANDEIEFVLFKIAEQLNLEGSINVQLRLTSKGPVVFEINPRFSSTVRFRHLFGFEDVKWSIEEKIGYDISNYTAIATGRKLYKGFNEYIQ